MEQTMQQYFPMENFGKHYESDREYLADCIKLCEMTLVEYLAHSDLGKNALDRLRGEILSAIQIQQLLCDERSLQAYQQTAQKHREHALLYIQCRKSTCTTFHVLDYVFSVFQMDAWEQFYFLLCLMPYYDERYETLFAILQNDITKKIPTAALAIRLYDFVAHVSQADQAHARMYALREKFQLLCLDGSRLDAHVARFVLCPGDLQLPHVRMILPDNKSLPVMDVLAKQIVTIIQRHTGEETLVFYLEAPCGAGKKTLAGNVAGQLGNALLCADVSMENEDAWLYAVCRQALLQRAFLCFHSFPQEGDKIGQVVALARQFCGVVFILTENAQPVRPLVRDCIHIPLVLHMPTDAEGETLWQYYFSQIPLETPELLQEAAAKFHFYPVQIAGAAQAAKVELFYHETINRRILTQCAYQQVSHALSQKATLLYANYRWEQLILADEEKEMLQNACDQVRFKNRVYGEWGFSKRLAYGRGVSMLFAGPPGTGKTMAAQAIAHELDIEIYKVDLSQIVSKYIGETEKNLHLLFEEARKSSVILLFDETDAILGKRTEVKDSHDKNANLETSYLLQKMEEYDGITIMTTNYIENIDQAFFRRIHYVVHFPFPDEKARETLWRTIFPEEMPIADNIDFSYLARQFSVSGGSIKNTAITAAFLAARQGEKLEMWHIMKALRYEMAKQGKVMIQEDFGEYGYLL